MLQREQPDREGRRETILALRLVSDSIAVLASVFLAKVLRFDLDLLRFTESEITDWTSHLLVAVTWFFVFLAACAINHLYDEDTLLPGGGELSRVARSAVETTGVISVFVFFTQTFLVSRSWLGLTVGLSVLLFSTERMLFRRALGGLRSRYRLQRPVVVVGAPGSPSSFLEEAGEFDVIKVLDYPTVMAQLESNLYGAGFAEGVRGNLPALLVHGTEYTEDELWRLVVHAGRHGLDVFLSSKVRSVGRNRLVVRELGGNTTFRIGPPKLSGFQGFQKRIFDVVVSILGLVLLAPLLLLLIIAIAVTSGRPVFYKQTRVGREGHDFMMYKFRSMRHDAETDTGAVWASPDDLRRTRLGQMMRRYSIDELPQLWNVLTGDMSIVGPRPERPIFVERFSNEVVWYEFRHRYRPGITGLAQARGLRGNTSLGSRIGLDNAYIEHWSLTFDLKIILWTFKEVLFGKHAY